MHNNRDIDNCHVLNIIITITITIIPGNNNNNNTE